MTAAVELGKLNNAAGEVPAAFFAGAWRVVRDSMLWGGTSSNPMFAAGFPAYFINQSVLILAALAAIPVILHFLLRHKPKKLLFPALRLIQLRKKNNIRRLRLKHLWLLVLRILIIVLLVCAVARPTLPAANYTPTFWETMTLLAIIVVAVGVYRGVLHYWRKRDVPNHVMTYRRSLLRGGTGIGIVLLALLLFVWPYTNRVFAEIDAPLTDVARNQPVAAVFLFDTSLTMSYTKDNESRLDVAKTIAVDHLNALPRSSQVALATNAGKPQILFQTDLVAVADRIRDKLKVDPLSNRKLDDLLLAAVARQNSDRKQVLEDFDSDRFLREVYIFTDLSVSGWKESASRRLREQLAKFSWLQCYIIDVGVQEPTDVAIADVKLSEQAVTTGAELSVDVKLTAVGKGRARRTLKLSFLDASGKKITKGQTTLLLKPGEELTHQFAIGNLTGPFQQAVVEIESTDPVALDDKRYFTVAVHTPPNVLLVSDRRSDTYIWQQALAPRQLPAGQRWFRCDYMSTAKFAGTDLSKYDAVYLINVRRPTADHWASLKTYVEGGGGLGIMLGMHRGEGAAANDVREAYFTKETQTFLPAEVRAQLDFQPREFLDWRDVSHPIYATFRKHEPTDSDGDNLFRMPVTKCWRVRPLGDAKTLAGYTNTRKFPALITRSVGRGRTLMFTTAVGGRGNWNELRKSGWPYVVLSHRMTHFLTGRAARGYNFRQGDNVRLYWDRRLTARPKLLRKPRTQIRVDTGNRRVRNQSGEKSISIDPAYLDETGNYQLMGNDSPPTLLAGFSFNTSPGQFDLTRMTDEQLDDVFGEKRYQIARDTETLNRVVKAGRLGKEIFPLVLLGMLLFFCGEHFVANRFYEADQAVQHG